MTKELVSLTYLILSTMIGAGILALPGVFYSVGLLNSLILFLLSIFLVYFASLILLKASLKAYKLQIHEVFEKYFGKSGKNITFVLISLTILFTNVAYLNAINLSLKEFASSSEILTLMLASIAMIIAFLGFKYVEKSEKILFIAKMIVYFTFISFIIFVPSKFEIKQVSFEWSSNLSFLLVSIFAFSFYTVIPSLLHISKNEVVIKQSFQISLILAFIFYFLFSFLISQRVGNSEIATLGFNELFNLLTIFLVITPYLILSWVLSEMIGERFNLDKSTSTLLAFLIPFVLFLVLPKSFLAFVEITSGIFIVSFYLLLSYLGLKNYKTFQISYKIPLFLLVIFSILFLFEVLKLLI